MKITKIALMLTLGVTGFAQTPRTPGEVVAVWRKVPGAASSQNSPLISKALVAYNQVLKELMAYQPEKLAMLRLGSDDIFLIQDKRLFLKHVMSTIWTIQRIEEEVAKSASAFVIETALPIIVDLSGPDMVYAQNQFRRGDEKQVYLMAALLAHEMAHTRGFDESWADRLQQEFVDEFVRRGKLSPR